MELWTRVRTALKQKRVTQEWLAEMVSVNPRTLQSWISRGYTPNMDEAAKIATVLGVSLDYLWWGESYKELWLQTHEDFVNDCKAISEGALQFVWSKYVAPMAKRERDFLAEQEKLSGTVDPSKTDPQ